MWTIALLTDFGTRDPYVASMKGVIASRCDARIEDLTHEIAAFDVSEAAWFLRTVERWWPAGTIFVCVVDPAVGTSRRIVAIENAGRVFLAPDNGLLTFITPWAAGTGHAAGVGGATWSIENEAFFLPEGSTTFHGRDRFAPVAAAIANGVPLDTLGSRIEDIVRLDFALGSIISVDRFGNLVTDIEPPCSAIRAGDTIIDVVRQTYAGADDRPFLILGSAGTVEISVNEASAADLLHLARGDRVEILRR